MFSFIPAWYGTDRPWGYQPIPWHRGGWQHRFDDTINQLRLFKEAQVPCQLLVLNYMPNLREVAHAYGLFEVPHRSLFDEFQDIKDPSPRRLDYRTLNWPPGVTFIQTPFIIFAKQAQELLAVIEFDSDGQLLFIDYFKDGQKTYTYLFDDRGFLSSLIYFQDGQPHHQDYLNPSGQWQLREFLLPDEHQVLIAEAAQARFDKASYGSMAELMSERIPAYLAQEDQSDEVLVIAAHRGHNQLLLQHKGSRQAILSYCQDRFDLSDQEALQTDLSACQLALADSLSNRQGLSAENLVAVEQLPPIDTRLSLGKSQRLSELIIHMVCDGLDQETLADHLEDIFFLMASNDKIYLSLVTYEADAGLRQQTQDFLTAVLAKADQPYLFFEDQKAEGSLIDQFDMDEDLPVSRVSFSHLSSELAIQKALDVARVIVDLRPEPDLYTQIAGISAGLPQINSVETEFVEHLKNGYVVEEAAGLLIALDYYLTGLANWNQALVYAVQKIEAYTGGQLVQRIKDRLEGKESDHR